MRRPIIERPRIEIEPTPAPWEVDLSGLMPVIRAGPVRSYLRGDGRSQFVQVFSVMNDDAEHAYARAIVDMYLITAVHQLLDVCQLVATANPASVDARLQRLAQAALDATKGPPR